MQKVEFDASVLPDAVARIVQQLKPIKVVLFGSRARGDADRDSDFDFLIVMPDGTDVRDATATAYKVMADLPIAKDVVVTTPEQIRRRGHIAGSILRPALREGVVLYGD